MTRGYFYLFAIVVGAAIMLAGHEYGSPGVLVIGGTTAFVGLFRLIKFVSP